MRVPLHELVRTSIRDRILSGDLAPGDALPSEAELCARFGASRGPIRQAMSALSAEGLIETSQGRVPTVTRAPLAQSIDDFFSFSAWVSAIGHRPGQHTIELALRRPDPVLASQLRIETDDLAVQLLRIRSIDGEPAMLERTAFVAEVGRLLFDFDTDAGSLFDYLIDRGVPLDHGEHTIDAIAADAVDSEHLHVAQGTPLLRVRRVTTSADGDVLEVSDDRYRTDRADLVVRNARTHQPQRPFVARQLTTATDRPDQGSTS
ncbi:GntR family transcriptional regulator [Planctomonas sp. JC2975]|uniref:GntR family transcriptional regulator n=1 Tax=Planctomonas sp. JC2975 TaxID=2729626 RepID=UPI00147535A6|nr:GntR family transcriptional regulator [Planctomonas sp. JC2975]NNC10365.1 GntR family transcriptional regulator [Planctomonas sp. JC2975]